MGLSKRPQRAPLPFLPYEVTEKRWPSMKQALIRYPNLLVPSSQTFQPLEL